MGQKKRLGEVHGKPADEKLGSDYGDCHRGEHDAKIQAAKVDPTVHHVTLAMATWMGSAAFIGATAPIAVTGINPVILGSTPIPRKAAEDGDRRDA